MSYKNKKKINHIIDKVIYIWIVYEYMNEIFQFEQNCKISNIKMINLRWK